MLTMLKVYGIVVGLLGIFFCLVAVDKGGLGPAAVAVGLMSLSLAAMVGAAVLKRWDRFAEKKWNVSKETKDNG